MNKVFLTKKVKKILGILISIILFIQQVIPVSIASAEVEVSGGTNVSDKVDFIKSIQLLGGNNKDVDLSLIDKVHVDSDIRILYTFELKNTDKFNKGDYCYLSIPKEINIAGLPDQELSVDGTSDSVGTFHVEDASKGIVKITFSEFAAKSSNVSGSFYIDSFFIKDQLGDGGEKELNFDCGNKTLKKTVKFEEIERDNPTIEKKAGDYNISDNTVDWFITLDCKDNKSLSNVDIYDTLVGANQTFVKEVCEIHEDTEDGSIMSNDSYNYSFAETQSAKISFNKPISGKKVIKLRSKLTDDFIKSISAESDSKVENSATLKVKDKEIETKTAEKKISQVQVTKSVAEFNRLEKKITWNITFKGDGLQLPIKITDTLGDNLTFKNKSAKIGNSIKGVKETKKGSSVEIELGTRCTFNQNGDNIVSYETSVENFDNYINSYSLGGITYNNKAELKDANNKCGTTEVNAKFVPDFILKTSKSYDYATNEITWDIVVNRESAELNNVVVKDKIPEDQEYVEGSFKVKDYYSDDFNEKLNRIEPSFEENNLEYNFKDDDRETIEEPYEITYKTKVTKKAFFESLGDNTEKEISNIAKIYADELIESIPSEGKCKVKISPIEKRGIYDINSDEIKWNILINRNSINMGNVTVLDNLNEGLKLDAASIKLYKFNATSDGLADYSSINEDDRVALTKDQIIRNGNQFKININDVNQPYVLQFSTKIIYEKIYKTGDVANTAEIAGHGVSGKSDKEVTGIRRSSAGAMGRGENGILKVKKVDETKSNPIKGAKFKLWSYFEDESEAMELETDKDGIVQFEGLRYDIDYYIKESKPAEGYMMLDHGDATPDNIADDTDDPLVKKINIPSKNTVKTIEMTWINKAIKGNLEVEKVDNTVTTKRLPGAKFTLYKDDGDGSFDSSKDSVYKALEDVDNDGVYVLKDIPYGHYWLKEMKAPSGYIVDNGVYDVFIENDSETVKCGNGVDNLFRNKEIASKVELTKIDENDVNNESPKHLTGAIFKIYKDNGGKLGKEVGQLKDDDNDGIYTGEYPCGKYLLVEEKSPEGYAENTEPFKFEIASEEKVIIKNKENYYTNTKIKGNISITKVEEGNTSKKLAGAEFTVYKDNGNGEFNLLDDIEVGKMTDLSDGKYEYKNLEYGTYWVKETKAAAGYKISTKKSDSNGAYKVVIDNKETKIVSNADDNLFEDTLIKGTVKIVKVDAENVDEKLSGAIFKVYQKTALGEEFKGTLSESDTEAGVYSISLTEGEYVLREETAPTGFNKDSGEYPFEITASTEIINITNNDDNKSFKNSPIKGKIVINKTASNDKTFNKLPGAVFEVYKDSNNNAEFDEGDALVDTISDVAGNYTSSDLRYGKYFVKEVQAPIGYVKDENSYEVNITINNDRKIVSNKNNDYFENDIIQGKVKVIKVDKDYPENKLSGAVFEVYEDVNKNGTYESGTDILVGTLNEDQKDKGSYYKDLSYGKYLLKEKIAPEGFIADSGYYAFEITASDKVPLVETEAGKNFINTCIKGTLELTKVDADYPENKLSGAIFKVYKDTDNNGIYTEGKDKELFELDEKSEGIYSKELRYGKYFIKEYKAPEGFVKDDTAYLVNIVNNGEKVIISNDGIGKNFINKCIKGSVKIVKVDADNHNLKLDGAKFKVYKDSNKSSSLDENDEFVCDLSEAVNGVYIKKGLYYGLYFIKEVTAPKDYIIDKEYYKFNINENNEEVVVKNSEDNVFVNEKKKGKVSIVVIEEEYNNPVKDALIKVYDKDNNVVYQGKTDSNGKVNVYDLKEGTYTYKVENVPEGYKVDTSIRKFDVKAGDEKETLVNVSESNEVIQEKPEVVSNKIDIIRQSLKTGDNSKIGILILITSISLIAIIAIGFSSRRKNK